jgi:membrane carboxypeptidase/penicillin-binding protein
VAPVEQATMSYGHGISVSLLQVARAYTVFSNDGACCRSRSRARRASPTASAVHAR